MRLLHKQQESYVVANGSFAGVFASLREIRRVHEMHPDFRISATQHSLDDTTLQTTELNRRSQTGTHTGKKERSSDPRTVIQVQADIEPGAPASGFTHEPVVMDWEAVQEVRPANAVQDRLLRGTLPEQHGGLDGSVTEDLESRGVVDEDGELIVAISMYCNNLTMKLTEVMQHRHAAQRSCSTEVMQHRGHAAQRSCSTEVMQHRGHAAQRSCSTEVMQHRGHQHRGHAAQRSCSTEVMQHRGHVAQRSCSTEVMQHRGHAAQRSCSTEVMQHRGHAAQRSCSTEVM